MNKKTSNLLPKKVRSGSKASKANKLMNSIAMMHENRGSQKSIFVLFIIELWTIYILFFYNFHFFYQPNM